MQKTWTPTVCDECEQTFMLYYDADVETLQDALHNNICFQCGFVLCPKCNKLHDCHWDALDVGSDSGVDFLYKEDE